MSERVKFYTIKQVRACDLKELDSQGEPLVVRINSTWRLVLHVYQENDDPTGTISDDTAEEILHHLDAVIPAFVAVRYFKEEDSVANGELSDGFHFLRYRDLVEVQVPEEMKEQSQ